MLKIDQSLANRLNQRRLFNAYRSLPKPQNELLDFCSNDYLGLAKSHFHSDEAVNQVKLQKGSTGSRLISGNSQLAENLEKELAEFHRGEAGLLFNSGYNANIGLLSAVPSRQDTILYDQLIHASLRDGIRLSNARSFSFRHNDLQQLEKRMNKATGQAFIVVESIYSMDGDEAPLEEIVNLANHYEAALIVDEAHSTGVFGLQGRGLVVEKGLESQVWARVHTFGKAIGGHGAIVVGSQVLREFLINFARSFIYTTALPDSTLQTIKEAYYYLSKTDAIHRLQQNIALFRSELDTTAKTCFIESRSPIQSLIWQGNDQVKALASTLQHEGFNIRPILHPTVPKGQERLRICLHAFNQSDSIVRLAQFINQWINEQK